MKAFVKAGTGLALALGIFVALPAGSARADNTKIVYAMPNIAMSQSFAFVAEKMGFWSKRGLDVDPVVIAGTATLAAVISGDAQFATNTGMELLGAVAHGQPLISVASIYQKLVLELVISKEAADKSGLTVQNSTVKQRAAALKGLTIGIDNPSSILDGLVKHVATEGGLDPQKDVATSPMQPPAALTALGAKRIDGFSMPLPWTTLAQANGTGVVWISGPRGDLPELTPFAFTTIVTRSDYCEKNPAICRAFVGGVVEAIDYMQKEPEKSLAIVKEKFGSLDPKVLAEDFEVQRAMLQPGASFSEASYANAQKVGLEAGVLTPADKRTTFEGKLYTNAYLK